MCDASTIDYLRNGPVEAPLRIALAHGAGQGMDSDFMNLVAEGLGGGEGGIGFLVGKQVSGFNYIHQARVIENAHGIGANFADQENAVPFVHVFNQLLEGHAASSIEIMSVA